MLVRINDEPIENVKSANMQTFTFHAPWSRLFHSEEGAPDYYELASGVVDDLSPEESDFDRRGQETCKRNVSSFLEEEYQDLCVSIAAELWD